MDSEENLSRLWERAIYRNDIGYYTFSTEIDAVPLLVVFHVQTLRFRVFVEGSYSKFDITGLIGEGTRDKIEQQVKTIGQQL